MPLGFEPDVERTQRRSPRRRMDAPAIYFGWYTGD